MKGMSFGNSPIKNDKSDKSKVDKKAVKKFTNLKEGKAGNILPQNKSLKPSAQEFLKANTVKQKAHVKAKGVLGPGTRPLDPKVTKDIGKVVKIGKNIGKRLIGPAGVAVTAYELTKPVAKWIGRSWSKAKNINMNAPENAKYAEWYYGSSKKSKNIGKSKQIKKGDKIKATGPRD